MKFGGEQDNRRAVWKRVSLGSPQSRCPDGVRSVRYLLRIVYMKDEVEDLDDPGKEFRLQHKRTCKREMSGTRNG